MHGCATKRREYFHYIHRSLLRGRGVESFGICSQRKISDQLNWVNYDTIYRKKYPCHICILTMSPEIVDRIKGFLMNPVETFRDAQGDDLGEVLTYFAVILAINAVLSGLLIMAGFNPTAGLLGIEAETGIVAGITTIIQVFISGFIGLFILALIIHLFVALIVGGNGVGQTIKAMAYGATPSMLLGWIPYVNLIGFVWAVILYVIGIRELHDTTTGRAAVAVLLPVIIIVLLITLLLAALVAFLTISEVTIA